ncbi:MAG: hypothetical protein RLZZ546_1932, partial [Bacteroidota bacterium]
MSTKYTLCPIFILLFHMTTLTAQVKDIIGKISDANGPIIGANVLVKGTDLGAITDIDGIFRLNGVAEGQVLSIAYTGYQTKEVTIDSNNNYELYIEEDNKILEEVVVTALGIKKEKAKLGYSTQEVDGKTLQ